MEEVGGSIDSAGLSKEQYETIIASLVDIIREQVVQIQEKDQQIKKLTHEVKMLTERSLSAILGTNQEESELPVPTLKYRDRLNKKQDARGFLFEHWGEWLDAKKLNQKILGKHDKPLLQGMKNFCNVRDETVSDLIPPGIDLGVDRFNLFSEQDLLKMESIVRSARNRKIIKKQAYG